MSQASRSLVLARGGPGIGKTQLTIAIANHDSVIEHFGEHRWFIKLENANTADQMKDSIVRGIGVEPQLGFDAALKLLSSRPSLLILDNLETPWETPGERGATENVLATLFEEGVAILASIRGSESVGGVFWEECELKGFAPPLAIDFFASVAGQHVRADPDLARFIEALGGIPLAIELVARRACNRESLSPLYSIGG